MDKNFYIEKNRTLNPSMDYEFLRGEGFKYIEQLSSALWTDYNAHDPGITLLETLTYVLTEIGYRNNFNIEDLLSNFNGETHKKQTFFTARKILTNEPLTVRDYRKMLVDILPINNAFLFPFLDDDGVLVYKPNQELPIFADCANDALSYSSGLPVQLNGLYKVLLDISMSDEFGDMNSGDIIYTFNSGALDNIAIKAILPNWQHTDSEYLIHNFNGITNVSVSVIGNGKWNIQITKGANTFNYIVILEGLKESKETLEAIRVALLELDLHKYIHKLYKGKVKEIREVLQSVKNKLHAHRNLCEDFLDIDVVPMDQLAVCADIDVEPSSDIEAVLAEVYFKIEQYLNPAIKFYNLNQLVESGYNTTEIFEGPRLLHGFIKDDEIDAAQIRTNVYVSDIINLIMDISGVKSVRNVQISRYNRLGEIQLPSYNWCVQVIPNHKPALDRNRSKVLFFKNKLPFKANLNEVGDTLNLLQASVLQNKMYRYAGDLEIPKGEYYDLAEYISAQNELPATYAVGENSISEDSIDKTELRKAQSKQLKGYLLFYDQIIADFFKQLANAKQLFSLDKTVTQTYFNAYLNSSDFTDLYTNASDLENLLEADSNGSSVDSLNRHKLVETKSEYYARRNMFLDHLLARFSENFNDYVLMLYTGYESSSVQKSEDELIEDKIDFLRVYPRLSSRRGKAFNYQKGRIWNSKNISGLELRGAKLAGIDNIVRRYLFCMRWLEIETTDTEPVEYFFRLRDKTGTVLLKPTKKYLINAELSAIIQRIYLVFDDVTKYTTKSIGGGKFIFELSDTTGVIAHSGLEYSSAADAKIGYEKLVDLLKKDCDSEGFHLIEHILLRPRFEAPTTNNSGAAQSQNDYKLMQVCLNDNCEFCGEEDPYSFRATLVIPYWPEKFRDLNFRKYFEELLNKETPAHILLKICWLDNVQMLDFEMAFKEWIANLQDYSEEILAPSDAIKNKLIDSNNKLVELMKQMHSEYPEARLHDCTTGTTNPVILNNTVLGNYTM